MKLSLLSKFTLVSFVLMAIIAVSLAWGIQQQLEQTALWQEATSAADEVTGILNPNLEKTDLTAPLDPARYAEIDALIRQNILHEHIVRVKIWSRDGLLLYSDQQDLVGQSYPLSDELAKALKGQIATDISTLDKPENAQQAGAHSQRLLEVYVPLRPMGSPQVLGAYEIYHDLTVVESSAASISRFVWSEVGVGFLLLFGALFALVRNASRQLISHSAENARLYEETKQRLAEREQTQEALLQSEERFRAVTESASDAIISADTAGTIIYWNKGAEKIFGYGEREAVGQPVALLVAERLKKSHERGIVRYQATGEAHIIGRPIEQVGVRKDGTEFPVELSINQWKLGGNNFFSAIVRDVSERKQAQEQIRHLLAEAERRLGQMEALHAIDIATANSLDVRFTLKVLIDQVTTHLGIDAADILLHNPHSQKLEFAVGHGFQTKALQYTRLRLGEGYAGRAALERRLVSVPDLKNADGLLPSALVRDEGFVSYFAAPMIAKGDVKGVLEIFHRAPLNADEEWLSFVETLAAQAAIAIDNATLFDNLQRSNTQLALAYDTTLEGWSRALDLRDRETEGHTQRVTEMSVRLARTMGIDEEGLVRIWRGALLHDMGKMAIPDAILLKPGPLDEQEWQSMRKHPVYAHEMLWPIEFLRSALDIPYGHHEKWDGTGYPRGLKGEQIPLHARIFALADIWDALCSDRPYRKAWPKERVIQHIQSLSGSHLDPQVVAQFMQSEFWRDDSVRLAVGSLT